jgi:hypothetical protein
MALSRGYLIDEPGNAAKIMPYPILSTQTYSLGDMLQKDSNGRLEQPVAVSTAYTSQLIAGMATGGALNDQGVVYAYGSVALWHPELQMALPLYSGTPASAVFNPNMLGNTYGMYNSSGGFPCVNFDDTSNIYFRVIGVLEEDYPGWPTYNGAGTTQYPKVIVVPLKAQCLYSGSR